MFTKKSFVDEIANSMQRQLVDGAINKQATQEAQLVKAADYLNAAAEIFDETGMVAHAEIITSVLEVLAGKKKENKAKDKKNKKSTKKLTKKTNSNKMVNNLKEKGWMFDENGAHDENCADDNCASCGDDDSEQWWHLSHPESGGYSNIKGSGTHAAKHLELKNKHLSPGWELNGPFSNIKALEEKHHADKSDDYEDHDVMMSDDSDELYSMLDNFKSKSHDMDFEDELDFDDFEDRQGVKVHDPFAGYDKVDVGDEEVKVRDPFSDFEKLYVDR